MPIVQCNHCKKEFKAFPTRIKQRKGKYCSSECRYAARRNKIKQRCLYCEKEFMVKPSRLEYGLGKYCSAKCHHLNYGNLYSEENSHCWKGDKAGYFAMHDWIKRQKGTPKVCENCGTTHPRNKYEWANISGEYRRDTTDWKRLCTKCHIAFDGAHVFGEKCGSVKLTERKVIKIREFYSHNILSYSDIAKVFGVCVVTIQKIIKRITWKHI